MGGLFANPDGFRAMYIFRFDSPQSESGDDKGLVHSRAVDYPLSPV